MLLSSKLDKLLWLIGLQSAIFTRVGEIQLLFHPRRL